MVRNGSLPPLLHGVGKRPRGVRRVGIKRSASLLASGVQQRRGDAGQGRVISVQSLSMGDMSSGSFRKKQKVGRKVGRGGKKAIGRLISLQKGTGGKRTHTKS